MSQSNASTEQSAESFPAPLDPQALPPEGTTTDIFGQPVNPYPVDAALESIPVPPAVPDRRKARAGHGGTERRASERRIPVERRVLDIGAPTGLERRRGPGRRLSDDRKSAEEGQMTDEQFEFVLAIDTYKRLNSRPFPSWTEVLEVLKQLGYRKVSQSTVNLPAGVSRSSSVPPPAAPTGQHGDQTVVESPEVFQG